MSVNLDKVTEILKECAALHILPRHQKLKSHEIRAKSGPHDLVTAADVESEIHLTKILPALIPGSTVIGEEAVSEGRTDLKKAMASDGPIWVIDPVDGTNNFANGGDQFGMLLALVEKGETRAGWIYDIPKREMTVAELGGGAFTEGRRLKIDAPKSPKLENLSAYMPFKGSTPEMQKSLKDAQKLLKETAPLFSAVHIYLAIVEGKRDFVMMSKLKPWDHLPGVLMVNEAGGYAAKWDQTPYRPRDADRPGITAAASKEIWDLTFNQFIKKHA